MTNRRQPKVYTRDSSANLWIRYSDHRWKLVRQTTGTPDPTKAQQVMETCIAEVAKLKAATSGISISEGFELFLRHDRSEPSRARRYRHAVPYLIDFCEERDIRTFKEVGSVEMNDFIDWRELQLVVGQKTLGTTKRGEAKKIVHLEVPDAVVQADLVLFLTAMSWVNELEAVPAPRKKGGPRRVIPKAPVG